MQENKICQYLKDIRKSHNYSQQEVASYLHITRQTYSHYETGRIIPPGKAIYHLAKLYEIPAEYFLELIVGSAGDNESEHMRKNMEMSEELSLSPGYNDISEKEVDLSSISGKEWQVLSYYRQMNEHEQNNILYTLKRKCQGSRQAVNSDTSDP